MVFGVSDKIPYKLGCTTTKNSLRLETSDLNREELYYLCSKNIGTYQVRSYCTADLFLCFLRNWYFLINTGLLLFQIM